MRIAYITYELPPDIPKGGIGTYMVQAAAAMITAGNEVHIFAGSHHRNISEEIEGIQIHRISCTAPEDFTECVLHKFISVNDLNPFDLIECPEIHGNGSLIKAKFPQIPLVVKLHAPNHLVESLKKTYTPFFDKLRFTLGAWRGGNFSKGWGSYNKEKDNDYIFSKLADVITAPSFAMKEWAIKNWKIPPEKIAIVTNPFLAPLELLNMHVTQNTDFKTILFFGRLNVLKGLVNFTKAIKIFLRENTDWKAIVIGDDANGPYKQRSMREWMKIYLGPSQSQVTFFEGMSQDKLYKKIQDCEIVVLPSLFETFSYACAEAMAAGKAIVGSNNGGMQDLLGNSECGITVNPYNANEIEKAIKKLAFDNALRYELSLKAKNKICSAEYNQNVSEAMIRVYDNAFKNLKRQND